MKSVKMCSVDFLAQKINLWPGCIEDELPGISEWHVQGDTEGVRRINGYTFNDWAAAPAKMGKDHAIATRRESAGGQTIRAVLNEAFLSDLQLAERYGVSRVTPWRWAKKGSFPHPVKLGENCTRWRLSEVTKWEEEAQRYECN